MVTRVNRPFLDREATVYSVDHQWTPNAHLNIRTSVIGSSVDHQCDTVRDTGAQVRTDHEISEDWHQQRYHLLTRSDLQLSDFYFLDRNNLNYGYYEISRRFTAPPEKLPYASYQCRFPLCGAVTTMAFTLEMFSPSTATASVAMQASIFEISKWIAGHNDLITRGNGIVDHPGRLFGFAERFSRRKMLVFLRKSPLRR